MWEGRPDGHLARLSRPEAAMTARAAPALAASAERAPMDDLRRFDGLAASIAHEVSQPLTGILTNASTWRRLLAAETPNLESARETLRRAIRDVHRAREVVSRMRGLFAGTEMRRESVNLNDAVRDVIALTAGELRGGEIT